MRDLPRLRDRPEERAPLLRLDDVLSALARASVEVPTPRTWRLELDAGPPSDLRFPLFLRTPASSWKLGGKVSRVRNERELADEADALRRAFGWDSAILAREWLDIPPAGESIYGPVPQEIRTWIVDGSPVAWSFHHLHVVPEPAGFPPRKDDLHRLSSLAAAVGGAFDSRLIVADFVRVRAGGWAFLEAGPGSCAGTAHEAVFKAVAARLVGRSQTLAADRVGGPLGVTSPRS